jgi:DnaJ-class molecular chaperone
MILYAVIGLFLSISLSNSLGKDLFDAYLTLGVEKDATKEQIKQAYRKLALDL